jgi:hypothetical protein
MVFASFLQTICFKIVSISVCHIEHTTIFLTNREKGERDGRIETVLDGSSPDVEQSFRENFML